MKVKCMACGVEKDPLKKEVHPYPEDGIVDDPVSPLWMLECQGADWRWVMVCHHCFHKLDPDMWISDRCWRSLNPITPFEKLPKFGEPSICIVEVQIVRHVESHFPGWVEAVLTDAAGQAWSFVDKVPVFTEANLDAQSTYPQPGVMACKWIPEETGEGYPKIWTIDTSTPWGLGVSGGETIFKVFANRVTRIAAL
ncbi:hypothetical protein DES53_108272 [Roseimicrobium gellanilyticum]|uniref:Uncharacterized protein n=1 Tax=Roseimicrobium gellanilyticum TaxID=748857 RepID=A0A366HFH3_9BACT|nr:hypothetical protein [Roseimicrobium gellanilyticum]RBP40565.1 hypothetical protein DES53_108272 [Roseimicrobium gellanilyticum]